MYEDNAKLGTAVREPVSHEILAFASRLAERADNACSRLHGKLQPVMTVALPTAGNIDKQPREYPPLFSDLREKFVVIEQALNGIEEAMSRTEL